MTWEEYLIAMFSSMDNCGKSKEEQLSIISDLLSSIGDVSKEIEKFEKMKSDGNDMKTVANIMGKVFVEALKSMGAETIEDLVDVKNAILASK